MLSKYPTAKTRVRLYAYQLIYFLAIYSFEPELTHIFRFYTRYHKNSQSQNDFDF